MSGEKGRLLLLNGPNLNLLGTREPGIYGALTLGEIEARLTDEAGALGYALSCHQSNHEDVLAQHLRDAAKDGVRGAILNAGAYTHTGRLLARAILESGLPVVEVHISNVFAREPFRHLSLIAPHCRGSICGLGYWGYAGALWALASAGAHRL